jgi:hypothetical protein
MQLNIRLQNVWALREIAKSIGHLNRAVKTYLASVVAAYKLVELLVGK